MLRKEDGRPHLSLFWLASPEPGVQTVKKLEVFNPSGGLVETILGQPMVEKKEPKPAPAKSPRSKAAA